MKERTIIEAIKTVLTAAGHPLTAQEVYDAIVAARLYEFKAERPGHVVLGQLRRHTFGVDIPSAPRTKHFKLHQNGRYYLLDTPVIEQRSTSSPRRVGQRRVGSVKATLADVQATYHDYLREFKRRVLEQVKKLDPFSFEQFCRNLLRAYGFRDVEVTRRSRDGGIDGFGKLKVGFAYFHVAFQCKRWQSRTVGRPEIDQFRGAIQGQFDQGIFFTTAQFSLDAESSSFKAGAVPIILINGPTLVDIMIEHNFGLEVDQLPVYRLALDNALVNETV
jgi:restriction system protein